MFGRFKRKPQPAVVTVSLNARLAPADRAALEDAFGDLCRHREIDAEVVGGGTLLAESGEVKACDIEIQLSDASPAQIEFVREAFTAMLAPVGSRLHVPDRDTPIVFGAHQGLALYLNGTDLPQAVYDTCDIHHVVEECERLLGERGMVNSHWQGPSETALYMYGADFEQMHAAIRPFLDAYPLCRECRVERIA
ncbi:hypothetical protein [Luteimonas sp. RC10]|uniref:hypothetical protein n=1 Tax=Luteimonas sp. RC10 TaxID=2587035 RepID=UPI0016132095|nr:hypothetical protein [Luteimonas sp. RC10]MBB3342596.1 hypothetical protein [Luteimonas sp. RC10]